MPVTQADIFVAQSSNSIDWFSGTPSVTKLLNGGFAVAYQKYFTDVGGVAIALFDANGNKTTQDFQANTFPTGNSGSYTTGVNPTLTTLSNGSFVVVWQGQGSDDSSQGIYSQIFTASGTKIGSQTHVNTFITDKQYFPTVSPLSDGGYLVIWNSTGQNGRSNGVYAQKFSSVGAKNGAEFELDSGVDNWGSITQPHAVQLTGGNLVGIWYGADGGVKVASGGTTPTSLGLGWMYDPVVTALNNGNYAVAKYSGDDVAVNIFTPTGTLVNAASITANTYTTNSQRFPAIATLNNGNFVVTWNSNYQDGNGWGIYAQQFTQTGTKVGSEIAVNTTTTGDQLVPQISALTNGGFVIIWGTDSNIYAKEFDSNGTALPPPSNLVSPILALGTGVSNGATAAEAVQAGGVISITGNVGVSESVIFTNGTRSVTKTLTGTGTPQAVTLTSADLTTLTNGTINVSATSTSAGVTSSAATTSFVLDTQAPSAPVFALGTGVSDGANATEATQTSGVVTINAENGASESISFTNGSRTLTKYLTGTGASQAVTLTSADLTTLTDGTISVSATVTDAAGNSSAVGSTSFVLNTSTPLPGVSHRIVGGVGNDTLVGIRSTNAMNSFVGGVGNDDITADSRADAAEYSGNLSNYTISFNNDTITIADKRTTAGNDGTDTLHGINLLKFADGFEFIGPVAQRTALTGTESNNTTQVSESKLYNGTNIAEKFVVSPYVSAMILAGEGDSVVLQGKFSDFAFTTRGTELQIAKYGTDQSYFVTTVNLAGNVTIRTDQGGVNARMDMTQSTPTVVLDTQTIYANTTLDYTQLTGHAVL